MESVGLTGEYFALFQEWNAMYAAYAKSIGLSLTRLTVLRAIVENPECTQKQIAECSFLPKQTVNAVITCFLKDGIIWLDEKPGDRRSKLLHFTQKGRRRANRIVGRMREFENRVMERLSSKERAELIRLTRVYVTAYKNVLENG